MLASRYTIMTHVAFVIVFAVLAFGVVAKIDCPYCGGTGEIKLSGGGNFQELTVVDVKTDTREETPSACDRTDLYQATVNMTLSNDGTEAWSGWVEANVTEIKSGEWTHNRYFQVQLGPGSAKSYSFIMIADMTEIRDMGFWDYPNFQASVGPAQGIIKCPFCDGTGKISILTMISTVVKGEKDVPQSG